VNGERANATIISNSHSREHRSSQQNQYGLEGDESNQQRHRGQGHKLQYHKDVARREVMSVRGSRHSPPHGYITHL
jgi:hypothetical protein